MAIRSIDDRMLELAGCAAQFFSSAWVHWEEWGRLDLGPCVLSSSSPNGLESAQSSSVVPAASGERH